MVNKARLVKLNKGYYFNNETKSINFRYKMFSNMYFLSKIMKLINKITFSEQTCFLVLGHTAFRIILDSDTTGLHQKKKHWPRAPLLNTFRWIIVGYVCLFVLNGRRQHWNILRATIPLQQAFDLHGNYSNTNLPLGKVSLVGSFPVRSGARSEDVSEVDLPSARCSESSCGLYGVTTWRGRWWYC